MSNAVLLYELSKEDSGKTVETICRKKLDISAGLLTQLKLNSKLTVNGRICLTSDILNWGDCLMADVTENEQSPDVKPVYIPIDIIYEDEFITVINKPRKMSVHQSPGNYGNTLANALVYHWNSLGEQHKFHAVNRLDKDTSGICIVAKNRFAHSALKDFKKSYLAIAHGIFKNKTGIIDLPIKRCENSVIKRMVSPQGKPSVTKYKVIKELNNMSLVELELLTGRTHQIRVHLSETGHALVGDWLYGAGDNEREIASGHLLHAFKAEFRHPATKELMCFTAPTPSDMTDIFKKDV